MYWTHRKGIIAGVDASGVQLRLKGRPDVPPVFIMKSFHFDVDLAGLFEKTKVVHNVTIDGMEVNIPPRDHHDKPEDQTPIKITGKRMSLSKRWISPIHG
jgi:hypothetical protein